LALVMEERLARGDSPYVVESLDCLGVVLGKQGRLAEAESTFREELALRQRRHEAESSGIAALLDHRALLLATSGRLDGALDMIQDALSIELASQGREPLSLVPLRSHLAWVQERLGQSVAPSARRSKLRTAACLHGTFGARAWVKSNYDLADLFQAQGKFSPAEALLKEARKFLECDFEGESSLRQRGLQRLIALYEAWDKAAPNTGKSAEAAGCRKYLEELEKARPSLSR